MAYCRWVIDNLNHTMIQTSLPACHSGCLLSPCLYARNLFLRCVNAQSQRFGLCVWERGVDNRIDGVKHFSDLGLSIHVVCKAVSTGLLMNSSRVTLQRVEAHIDMIPALSTFDFPYVFGSWRGVKLQCVWKLTST